MKTVLITGGARRLGQALVFHYARAGWRVLLTAQWSFEEGMRMVEELGPNVHCIRAQLSTQSNASLIQQWAATHTDGLDLIICNASSFKRIAFADTRPDQFEELLGSNLMGPYFLAQQCLAMLKKSRGCVVNIADVEAMGGVPYFSAYTAAKAALISITKSLAVELAPEVRVNAILPGTLHWPIDDAEYSDEERAEILNRIPLQRIGDWSDVVAAVEYVADASFVTGGCIPVDGGRSARIR